MASHSSRQKGQQPHKEKVCEICGDIGFQKAIITCYRCKNIDVHQYCVVGCFEDAPDDWSCEQCVRVLENKHSEESKLQSSEQSSQSTLSPKKRIKFHGGHNINWEKEVQTGKTRYLPVKEALNLLNSVSSRVVLTKFTTIETQGNSIKPITQISNSFLEKRIMQSSLGSIGYTQPHNLSKFRTIESSKKQVPSSSKGIVDSSILEFKSSNALKMSVIMNPLMTHYDPALAHSWKGSFEIFCAPEIVPKMLNNCIQAHSPSKARRKVYEFLRLLPDNLKFQLVPRGNIWASLFNNHIPGKEDIGLYFFTNEKKRYGIYNTLVDYIRNKDLVMRTVINDVELLVFASTVLHIESQKLSCTLWNDKHFRGDYFTASNKTQKNVLKVPATKCRKTGHYCIENYFQK